MADPDEVADLQQTLHDKLVATRAHLLSRLDGLGDHDLRRPLVVSGTNLLGLVKHLAGLEYGYLGACFGRPAPEVLPWIEDGSVWVDQDMWATAEESSAELVALYRRAAAHADRTVRELPLDAVGEVPWWPAERRRTTLGFLLVRMTAETAQHAGHADILRELIDSSRPGGPTDDDARARYAQIQAAADVFRPPHHLTPAEPPSSRR